MKPRPFGVLITGGSSDIGSAIAARRSRLGDRVIVTASSAESLKKLMVQYEKLGIRAEGFVFDLESPEASAKDFEKLAPLDAVILNACSRVTTMRRVHELSETSCRQYIDTNVHGNLWLLRKILPGMVERKFGRCVFVSSLSAMGTEKYGIYCLAKAALEGLFMNLAIDYGADGILCNVLRPGIIQTQRTRRFWRSEKYVKTASHFIPQGELGKPEHIAIALDPLLARESYINGSTLTVSGGLPLHRFPLPGLDPA